MKAMTGILVFVVALVGFVVYQLQKKPTGSAANCGFGGQKILFIGDSLTRGTIGFDFVAELRNRLQDPGKVLLNAGVNGDRVESLLNRLPSLMKCDSEKIVILIGTNDVILSDDLVAFKNDYSEMITRLKSQTHADIAITSLPLLAGDLESSLNQKIRAYSKVIGELAQQHSVAYLPLYERQTAWKKAQSELDPMTLTLPLPFIRRPFLAGFRRYILRQSLETISDTMGSQLTLDGIHLNSISGQMVADVTEPFIEKP